MDERRREDRRKGDRRATPRCGVDRRRCDRRQVATAAALTASLFVAEAPSASAQIYTRKNAKGVVEATNIPEDPGDYRLAYPKRLGVLIHSPGFKATPSTNSMYDDLIGAAAALHGVETAFVRAVIQTESQFDARAVSSVGAQGLMQLMPATARRFGVADAFDPRQNIFGGVRYLRWLLDKFGGDVALASAGYNAGENAVVRYGGIPPYKETQGYVRKVVALLQAGGAAPAPEAQATVTMASYTPGGPAVGGQPARAVRPAAPSKATARAAAQPRFLYRWKDERGVVHMTETPPPAGEYETLRASD
jgi:hypothetical protein